MTAADITARLNAAKFTVISCHQVPEQSTWWRVQVASHVWTHQKTIMEHVASAGLQLVQYNTEPATGAYLIVKKP